jgi:hypothetical protein
MCGGKLKRSEHSYGHRDRTDLASKTDKAPGQHVMSANAVSKRMSLIYHKSSNPGRTVVPADHAVFVFISNMFL